MERMPDFTVLVLHETELIGEADIIGLDSVGTMVHTHTLDGDDPQHLLALLLIAAVPMTQPHQRVKLLAIIKELEAGLFGSADDEGKPSKD